jgi:uncharacterized protein YjdB
MPRLLKLLALLTALAMGLVACGRTAPLDDDAVVSLRLLPEAPDLYIGQRVQLAVEARLADGTVQDVTGEPDLVLRLNQSGVVQLTPDMQLEAEAAGRVRLLAAWRGKQDHIDATVRDATLDELAITPIEAEVDVGESLQLTVIGRLSDGTDLDLTRGALGTSYASDTPAVATPTGDGLVFAMNPGRATITAKHEGLSATCTLRVGDGTPELVELALQPATANLPVGETLGLTLTGTYADGSSAVLSDDPETVFSSSDATVAEVSPGGRVTGLRAGEVEIRAVYRELSALARITVTAGGELEGIELSPQRAELSLGGQLQLAVAAVYSDGNRRDVTAQADYTSSNPVVAAVQAGGLIEALAPGGAQVMARYQGFSAAADIEVLDRTLESLAVDPAGLTLAVGQQAQLQVTGRFDDGSQADLTAAASGTRYQVEPAGVASAGPDGLITALAAGEALVRISNAGVTTELPVVVTGPQPVDLVVLPESVDLAPGQTAPLQALAFYSDGSQRDVTAEVDWTSDDPAVATVGANGLVRAVAAGSTLVRAELGGLLAAAEVRVSGVELIELQVEPAAVELGVGEQVQLVVTGFYSDGGQQDVTALADYSASNPNAASVSATGLVSAHAPGQSAVTAQFEGLRDRCSVTVRQVTVVDFWLEPTQLELQPGGQAQLTAWAQYSDGRLEQVTAATDFSSSNPGVAQVAASGLVSAAAEGETVVTGRFAGFEDAVDVRVVAQPELIGIAVEPSSRQIDPGQSFQLSVLALYSDGSSQDVTARAGYTSSVPAVATVDAGGLVRGVAPGQAEIGATFGGFADACLVTVAGAEVSDFWLEPDQLALQVGERGQLQAFAMYSDGRVEDVTSLTDFVSNDPTVAAVDAGGEVAAQAPGNATVTGSFAGFGDDVAVAVDQPVVQTGLEVTPASAALDVGDGLQLTVEALYSDGSRQDVTALAGYTSSDPTVAAVDPTGSITALAAGQATVSASFGGFDDSCLVSVAQPLLERIEVTPASAGLDVGETLQLTVTGFYSDGTQSDLTAAATGTGYETSDASVAAVGADGLVSALAPGGPVTITARNAGYSDSASITVADYPVPVLDAIDPEQVVVGAAGTELRGLGSGFVPASVLQLDGGDLATTFIDSGMLSASLPAAAVNAVAIRQVTVHTPAPGGGTSAARELWVVDVPQVSTVSPDSGLQGRSVRVGFYGSGLLGCALVSDNPGIDISNVSYQASGLYLFATFQIAADAPLGPAQVTLSNLAGETTVQFEVLEDTGPADCLVGAGEVVFWSGVQTCDNVVVDTGAVVYGTGDVPLQLLATGDVSIRGEIYVSGFAGETGYFNPADGGAAGPGGGGGGGGGDGELEGQPVASGGPGSPAGEDGQGDQGRGTPSGHGGGTGAGSGIAGGCGQAGGGGGFGGSGGAGGGDAGPGAGGSGGAANTAGSDFNGGTGGGGGSTCGPNSGGGGGGGGGVLVIATTGGQIDIEGALYADGGDGGDGYNGTGGGGGGSGGRITVTTAGGLIRIEDTLSARGGDGGPADNGDAGGGGGGGRILIDADGGGVDDVLGYYDVAPGAGGESRENQGYDGLDGQPGAVEIQP